MYKALFLAASLTLTLLVPTAQAAVSPAQATVETVEYLQQQYRAKGVTTFDDWSVIALSAAGEALHTSKWGGTAKWQQELSNRVGELDPRKTTDFARFTVTVVAAGLDPSNIGGVNLLDKLRKAQLTNGKFADSINGQGQGLINAQIWSILAFYMAGEQIPREKLAKAWLVSKQLPDGGFQFDTEAKSGGIDMTAMALFSFRALGMTKGEQPVVRALAFLQKQQAADGGFREGGTANAESVANVISALIAYGEKPANWQKSGNDLVESLLSFQKPDGSFSHTRNGMSNRIATAQALLGLADLKRGRSYVPYMREQAGAAKLARLDDLTTSHWAYQEMSDLVKNGYLTGVNSHQMKPNGAVTRSQFAALLLRAIGEQPNAKGQGTFRDVPVSDWSVGIVEKASALGLMQGGQGKFRPHLPIRHEEMAVISSRVAKKYGWKKSFPAATTQVPWNQVSSWAKVYVQDLQTRKLLGGTATKRFTPKANVTRSEAAVMLYRLLSTR